MNPVDIAGLISSIQIWGVVKILFSFALLIYVVFAFLVVKQVNLMIETLQQVELPLKAVALIHLMIALFVFVLAILIL